jgi:hypothetical protein
MAVLEQLQVANLHSAPLQPTFLNTTNRKKEAVNE